MKILINFSKIDKNTKNENKSNGYLSTFRKSSNIDESFEKTNSKHVLIIHSKLEGLSMIPVTTLYDEYIERPKLIERKKCEIKSPTHFNKPF